MLVPDSPTFKPVPLLATVEFSNVLPEIHSKSDRLSIHMSDAARNAFVGACWWHLAQVGSMPRNRNPSEPAAGPAPGLHSQKSILLPRDKVPQDIRPRLTPGSRPVEVHVSNKLPPPLRAYECKTNGGLEFHLSAKDISNYLIDRQPCLLYTSDAADE